MIRVQFRNTEARLHLLAKILPHFCQREQLTIRKRRKVWKMDLLRHETAADIAQTYLAHPLAPRNLWHATTTLLVRNPSFIVMRRCSYRLDAVASRQWKEHGSISPRISRHA